MRSGVIVLVIACAPLHAEPRRACFDIVGERNSRGTQALFDARHCQGGGVTWAGIVRVLAKRRGVVESERFSIDDEADAVRTCADDRKLVQALKADSARLNGDAAELRRVMNEAPAEDIECFEADGKPPKLPPAQPQPRLPVEQQAQTRAKLEQLVEAIVRQPLWCLPKKGLEGKKGTLRLDRSGTAMLGDDSGVDVGHWMFPPAGNGDDRIEVEVSDRLWHFNLGESGRLGFDAIGKDRITRVELTPGACR